MPTDKLWDVSFVTEVFNRRTNEFDTYVFARRLVTGATKSEAAEVAFKHLADTVEAHQRAGAYPHIQSPNDCYARVDGETVAVITAEEIKAEKRASENTDLYYKGRAEQAIEDQEFYKKVTNERKDNLLSFLREVRSESLSDETSSSRHRIEAIIRFVERQ